MALRGRFTSIKLRIVLIVTLFAFATALITASLSLLQLRSSARRDAIQSTEFSLNLVAGVISKNLIDIESLCGWLTTESEAVDYISGANVAAGVPVRIVETLDERAHYNYAYQYILRFIIYNGDYTRIFQVGSGTSAGIPVSVSTMTRLAPLQDALGLNRWQGFVTDPFFPSNSVLCRFGGLHKRIDQPPVGYTCLMASANLITDPLKDYKLPEGYSIFMTCGGKKFDISGAAELLRADMKAERTDDATLDSHTEVTEIEIAGGETLLAVSCPVENTDIRLTQVMPLNTLIEPKEYFMRQLLLIFSTTALLALLVFALLDRTISRPIRTLWARMTAISGGDFTPDPSIEWNNELGDVGRGINTLSKSVSELLERRIADEKAKQDLEYRMLQSQINPHFMYNTLNTIKWMATIQNAPGIAEITTSLARLLKNVSKGSSMLIPLSGELALLDDYYVIQKYRYGGVITLTKCVEPDSENALIPRFTLQPLLENAIFHGIVPKDGAGTVEITAKRDGGDIVIVMADDGIGMDKAMIARLFAGDGDENASFFKKIGFANVHRRIQYEFGVNYGLWVDSKPNEYTRVTIRIPYKTENSGEESEC